MHVSQTSDLSPVLFYLEVSHKCSYTTNTILFWEENAFAFKFSCCYFFLNSRGCAPQMAQYHIKTASLRKDEFKKLKKIILTLHLHKKIPEKDVYHKASLT